VQRTRLPILRLAAACLFAGCTVVPDPTASGLDAITDSSRQAIIGNWKAQITSATTRSTRRLSLSKGFWYQRWTTDSIFTATTSQVTLLEQGSWSWADSSRLILVPTYRQVGALVAANLADTIHYGWMSDSIQWVSHRDSLDTIYWHPG